MADPRQRRNGIGWLVVAAALGLTPAALAQSVQDVLKNALAQPAADDGRATADQTDAADVENAPDVDEPQEDSNKPVVLTEAELDVSSAGTVYLNVVELPLETVLRLLSLKTNRNIITSPAVQGQVTASLHDVTFEEALDAILISNRATYRAVGKFIYVYSDEEMAEIIASENPPVSRVFRLNYVPAADAEAAITPLLSAVGKVSASEEPQSGLAGNAEDGGGASLAAADYLVVYDRPENLEAIEVTIKSLDVRPKQVLVEATILSAELNDENALGVDFTVLGGVDLELLGSSSQGIQNVSVGALPTDRFEKLNASATTNFTTNVPDGGIRVGILKDQVAVFVEALERITDTVVMANPKVLALNKQKGQVIVGRRDGFITTTVTETQAIQTVEFLETGTQLIFRPFVGDDGFVRMELHPEDSIGGLNAANLPFEQTTEVTTNVIVEDGQTILIGGLFREVDSDTRSQVPLLGDIPVLGTVFQSHNDDVLRQEVIILLTVRVIKDFDAYARESWQAVEDAERLRVGLRRGQLWFSRERIAHAYYQTALEHFAANEPRKARWYARLALYNNPMHISAIKLQEELRGRRAWEDEGTATRSFIFNTIMRQRGIVEPMYERPAPPFVKPEALPEPLPEPVGYNDSANVEEVGDEQG